MEFSLQKHLGNELGQEGDAEPSPELCPAHPKSGGTKEKGEEMEAQGCELQAFPAAQSSESILSRPFAFLNRFFHGFSGLWVQPSLSHLLLPG